MPGTDALPGGWNLNEMPNRGHTGNRTMLSAVSPDCLPKGKLFAFICILASGFPKQSLPASHQPVVSSARVFYFTLKGRGRSGKNHLRPGAIMPTTKRVTAQNHTLCMKLYRTERINRLCFYCVTFTRTFPTSLSHRRDHGPS